jgi:hypothetical protein
VGPIKLNTLPSDDIEYDDEKDSKYATYSMAALDRTMKPQSVPLSKYADYTTNVMAFQEDEFDEDDDDDEEEGEEEDEDDYRVPRRKFPISAFYPQPPQTGGGASPVGGSSPTKISTPPSIRRSGPGSSSSENVSGTTRSPSYMGGSPFLYNTMPSPPKSSPGRF